MEGIFIYMNTTKLTKQIDKEIHKVNSKLNETKGTMNSLESELKKLLELRGALAPFNTQTSVSTPIDVNSSLTPPARLPIRTPHVSVEAVYNNLPQTFTMANLQAIAEKDFAVTSSQYKYSAVARLKANGWIETVKGQFQTYEKIRDRKL